MGNHEPNTGDTTNAGVALGKGAWDCDARKLIPPEKEAEVFEEVPNMDFPFEGIPTVPLRKDTDHMVFFCGGCRYRVSAQPEWPIHKVKQALFDGGIARANKPEGVRNTPGIQSWADLTLIYAGQHMADNRQLMEYQVPPGCQVMIAIETAKLKMGKPDPDSAFWN